MIGLQNKVQPLTGFTVKFLSLRKAAVLVSPSPNVDGINDGMTAFDVPSLKDIFSVIEKLTAVIA